MSSDNGLGLAARAHSESQRLAINARGALLLVIVVTSLLLGASSPSFGGTINVWACHRPDRVTVAPMDRWSSNITAPFIDTTNTCASNGAGAFGINVYASSHPGHSYGTWNFAAPPNTTVTGFQYARMWSVWGWASYEIFRGNNPIYDSPHLAELCQAAGGCHDSSSPLSWNTVSFGLNNEQGVLLMVESCALAGGCDSNSNGWASIHEARVTLEDTQAPTFTNVSGSLIAGGTVSGNASLSFQAADLGTGVYKVHATIDGNSWDDRTVDLNSGKCASETTGRDFLYAVPCRPNVSVSTTLSTASLPDGQHAVNVSIEDAAGNTTTVVSDVVTTHNAPSLIERPEITGTAKIGAQLTATTGAWSRAPTSYGYRWLRCPTSATLPSDAEACVTIAGATSSTYTPVTADVYGRLMVRVTATNASGMDSAVSAPSALVADSESRTSPPPPSDSGSRDVVIVPVPPSDASSSSTSTTTIINPPAGSQTIDGLHNPVAGPGHAPNGTNAGEGARANISFEIRVGVKRRHVSVVRSTRNRRWVIAGRLTNAGGKPIGRGQLVAAWQIAGRWSAHTGVTTRDDGTFKYVLPKGPSRKIKFVYFAFSDSSSYSETNEVVEKVSAPVRLKITPRQTQNKGRPITFKGRVGTDLMPKRGVLVTLEGREPGEPWHFLYQVRADHIGKFKASYTFKNTHERKLFKFRARVAPQSGYPYERGTSQIVSVLVTP